ncbi:MAG: PAS domain S-box protein [Armatimonadetes bacterium]|nr:PAS domain S-box protein [Armatimonadota bacterium]
MARIGRKASEERFRAINEASPFGIFVTDLEARVDHVNRIYTEITGLTIEEALGLGHRSVIHPDDRGWLIREWESHDVSAGKFERAHRIKLKDGTVKWVRIILTPIWSGKTHVGWIGTMEDITDQRKQSLALKASEERFRAISDASPFGIIVTEPNSMAYHVNERYTEITGLTADEAFDMGHRQVVHPDDIEELAAAWESHDASSGPFRREHRLLLKNGDVKWVRSIVSPMIQDGRLTGLVATLQDITADKAAEAKLRSSEERFRAVTDDSPVGIIIRDSDDVVVYANRAIAAIIGQDVESLVGTNYQATVHPADADDLSARLTAFLNYARKGDGAVFRSKHRIIVGETTKWVSTTTVPMYLSDGSVRYANEVHDITDQVEFEYLIRASEERFHALAEGSPMGISIRDSDGMMVYANPALALILGVPADELRGRQFLESLHPDDLERVDRGVAEFITAVNTGVDVLFRSEHRILVDGKVRWIETTSAPIRYSGDELGFVTITHDVTQRHIAEEQLAASEERFRSMAASSPIGIFTHDADGSLDYVNEAFCRINRIEPEQAMGGGWLDLVQPDLREEARRMWHEFTASAEKSMTGEIPGVRNGEEFWARTHTVKTWLDGKLTGYIGTYEDISAQKQAEKEIVAAKAAAESAITAKNEFLSRMSHELRTPLNTILGFAQLLEMESLADRQREGVANILYAGRHLLGLINDVLDIARIEDRRISIDCALLDVPNIVAQVVNIMKPIAEESDVTISQLNIEPGLTVYGDERRLAQVLLNLVSNAVKYNVPSGTVIIDARQDDGHVLISVVDTGVGIPAEKLDQVFTPFDRLGAEQTDVEGSGLGLAVADALVRAMAGEIRIESEEGSGTTATIRLPAEAPAKQELQPQ